MIRNTTVLLLGFFLLLASLPVLGCRTQVPSKGKKEESKVKLKIISPKENENVQGLDVNARVKVEGVKLVKPGGSNDPNEGHLHYTFDGQLKMTEETTVTYTSLSSGEHTLTIELVQNDHNSRSPALKKTVRFNVSGAAGENEGERQQEEPPTSNY